MKVRHIFILVVLISLGSRVDAQQEEPNTFNSWWSFKAKMELSDRFYVNSQVSLRRYNFLADWQKFVLRARGLYRINELFVAGFGYTYSRSFDYEQPERYVAIPRHEFFTELGFTNEFDELKLINRFRLEHRFSGIMIVPEDISEKAYIDGTKFSNRLRYRATFKHPLIKENGSTKLYAAGFYELFLRMDGNFKILNISGNIFKIVGGYKISKKVTIEAGYRRSIKHEKDYSFKEINNTIDLALKYRFDFTKYFSRDPFIGVNQR